MLSLDLPPAESETKNHHLAGLLDPDEYAVPMLNDAGVTNEGLRLIAAGKHVEVPGFGLCRFRLDKKGLGGTKDKRVGWADYLNFYAKVKFGGDTSVASKYVRKNFKPAMPLAIGCRSRGIAKSTDIVTTNEPVRTRLSGIKNLSSDNMGLLLAAKKFFTPITSDTMVECGVVEAGFSQFQKSELQWVLGIPAYAIDTLEAINWQIWSKGAKELIYRVQDSNGKFISTREKTLAANGRDALGNKLPDAILTSLQSIEWLRIGKTIRGLQAIRLEGPKDMLTAAQLSKTSDRPTIAFTNLYGASSHSINEQILERLRAIGVEEFFVVGDCDSAGVVSAAKWTEAARRYIPVVRNLQLPLPYTEKKGADFRDWVAAEVRTWDDVLSLPSVVAEVTPRVITKSAECETELNDPQEQDSELPDDIDTESTPSDPPPDEAVDDPHRLARVNLDQYREGHGREIKYWNESWYLWKRGQYIEAPKDHFLSRLNASIKREFDRAWYVESQAHKEKVERDKKAGTYEPEKDKPPQVRKVKAALVRDVLEATKGLCFISSKISMHSWLDKRNSRDTIVSVDNGLLNITKVLDKNTENISEVLSPHDPNWFSTAKLPFQFDMEAQCPAWVDFLESAFNGDQESIDALQMWFGYLLTPDVSLHKVLFVIGPTRSGKGTIISVLRELLGHESIATPTLSSLGQPFGLASLVGKTAAIIADARMPGRVDEMVITERLLNISGGDPVSVARKFKTDLEDFKLPCRFTLFSNLLPKLKDASAVFVNRCIFLNMPNSYLGREDRTLGTRLLAEMSGILNWAILGRDMLSERGKIPQPVSGMSLLNELRAIMSPVSMFLSERCEVHSDNEVATQELFAAYEEWCAENDVCHPGDIQAFGRKLKAVCPSVGTYRKKINPSDYDRTRLYTGLTLRVATG